MPRFVGFVVSEVVGELQQGNECCYSSLSFVTLQVPPTVSLGYCAGVPQTLNVPRCSFTLPEALPWLVADGKSHHIFHLVPKKKEANTMLLSFGSFSP